MYRPRSVAPYAPSPGAAVYAPITVHPVTVNVDGGVFANQMETMTKRFEELLQVRDAVGQKIDVAEPVSKKRKVPRTERRSVRPVVSSAHTEQLDQLNRRLRDIAESFERFQNQTQRTVNDISNEGRRTEMAFEEIRSLQRQLESQIERARLTQASPPGVVYLPMTQLPATPVNPALEFPKSESPVTPASKHREVPRRERRSVRPVVSSAHTEQLDQLNRRLRDIAESFERFQNQTQRTVNDISNEGRRTEMAFEEIRSLQRQVESLIERARLTQASPPGVVYMSMTQVPAAPANPAPELPTFESPVTVAVTETAAAPFIAPEEVLPPSISVYSKFKVPAAESQGDPFVVGKVESGPSGQQFQGAVPGQVRPSANSSATVGETSATVGETPATVGETPATVSETPATAGETPAKHVEPEPFGSGHRLLNPVEAAGVSAVEPVISQRKEAFDVSKEQQMRSQANNVATPSMRDAEQSDLYLAYKARRLMQEAEKAIEAGDTGDTAIEAGDTAIAGTRAMQARGLATSAGLTTSRSEHLAGENQLVDGLMPFSVIDALSVVDSVSATSLDVDSEDQQTPQLDVQGRAAIAAGDFRLVMDLANEAETLDDTYEAHEDSPRRLKENIASLKEVRVPASVVVEKISPGESSQPVETPYEPAEQSAITLLIEHLDSEKRNVVKPVAFEHAYSFDLTDVEPASGISRVQSPTGTPCKQCGKVHGPLPDDQDAAASKGRSAESTADEKRFGRNAARRSSRPPSDDRSPANAVWDSLAFPWLGNVEPDSESAERSGAHEPTGKKKLFAPHGARRSNRRIQAESNDTTEPHAIWDTPVLQPASAANVQDDPSQLHRLTSSIRRIGQSATE